LEVKNSGRTRAIEFIKFPFRLFPIIVQPETGCTVRCRQCVPGKSQTAPFPQKAKWSVLSNYAQYPCGGGVLYPYLMPFYWLIYQTSRQCATKKHGFTRTGSNGI